jgi:KUP system potassium uptake protein
MRGPGDGVPHAMLHNLSHNKVLHECVVFLTVYQHDVPYVPVSERIQVHDLGHNCYQMDMHYGFKNVADIPQALELSKQYKLDFNMMETSFFIARQNVIATPGSGMALWREQLFVSMSRNARDAADYYRIPANRVIELGTQVEI